MIENNEILEQIKFNEKIIKKNEVKINHLIYSQNGFEEVETLSMIQSTLNHQNTILKSLSLFLSGKGTFDKSGYIVGIAGTFFKIFLNDNEIYLDDDIPVPNDEIIRFILQQVENDHHLENVSKAEEFQNEVAAPLDLNNLESI